MTSTKSKREGRREEERERYGKDILLLSRPGQEKERLDIMGNRITLLKLAVRSSYISLSKSKKTCQIYSLCYIEAFTVNCVQNKSKQEVETEESMRAC